MIEVLVDVDDHGSTLRIALCQGELEDKPAALSEAALDVDRAAVGLDDAPDDGEAEPRARNAAVERSQ